MSILFISLPLFRVLTVKLHSYLLIISLSIIVNGFFLVLMCMVLLLLNCLFSQAVSSLSGVQLMTCLDVLFSDFSDNLSVLNVKVVLPDGSSDYFGFLLKILTFFPIVDESVSCIIHFKQYAF